MRLKQAQISLDNVKERYLIFPVLFLNQLKTTQPRSVLIFFNKGEMAKMEDVRLIV